MAITMAGVSRYLWTGLSGDTKPTDSTRVGVNDLFLETDTQKRFIFKNDGVWYLYTESTTIGDAAGNVATIAQGNLNTNMWIWQPSSLTYIHASADVSGNLNTTGVGGGGGTQYVDGVTQATPTGTVALGKNPSNVLHAVAIDASGNLLVNVAAGSTGNAAAGATGAAVPASAGYTGWNSGGNLTGVALTTALPVQPGTGTTWTITGTVTTTPPANASTNVAQFGGTNVSTGTGVGGVGIPRVTVSSDSTVGIVGALPSGANTIGSVNIIGTVPVSGTVAISNLPLSGNGNVLVETALAGVDIGPALMESSLPVTLAIDQDIPIRPTGQLPAVQSVSVVLATDQAALSVTPFNPTALPLPTGAAVETGNLATIATANAYMAQMVELLSMLLSELRANNVYLASMTGVSVDPAIGQEQATYQ